MRQGFPPMDIYTQADLDAAVDAERARLLAPSPCGVEGHTMAEWLESPWQIDKNEEPYCRTCREVKEETRRVQDEILSALDRLDSPTLVGAIPDKMRAVRDAAVTAALDKAAVAICPKCQGLSSRMEFDYVHCCDAIRAIPRDSSALREREEEAVRWAVEYCEDEPFVEQMKQWALEDWRKK